MIFGLVKQQFNWKIIHLTKYEATNNLFVEALGSNNLLLFHDKDNASRWYYFSFSKFWQRSTLKKRFCFASKLSKLMQEVYVICHKFCLLKSTFPCLWCPLFLMSSWPRFIMLKFNEDSSCKNMMIYGGLILYPRILFKDSIKFTLIFWLEEKMGKEYFIRTG